MQEEEDRVQGVPNLAETLGTNPTLGQSTLVGESSQQPTLPEVQRNHTPSVEPLVVHDAPARNVEEIFDDLEDLDRVPQSEHAEGQVGHGRDKDSSVTTTTKVHLSARKLRDKTRNSTDEIRAKKKNSKKHHNSKKHRKE